MLDSFVRRLAGTMLAGAISLAGCGGGSEDVVVTEDPPSKPTLVIGGGFRALTFEWTAGTGATRYTLKSDLANSGTWADAVSGLTAMETSTVLEVAVHRFDWEKASFKVEACNDGGCVESDPVPAAAAMAAAVGYAKASNAWANDQSGAAVAISADGSTLAIGAPGEDSAAIGIGGTESESCSAPVTNCAADSGAVYVYVRSGANAWVKQAYVKASNTGAGDAFGTSVALSADGNTLIVGAPLEDSFAGTVGGDQTLNNAPDAGAAYTFRRSMVDDGAGGQVASWVQEAYLKTTAWVGAGAGNHLGAAVALSADGSTAVVGEPLFDLTYLWNVLASDSGRASVFVRNASGVWTNQASLALTTNYGASDVFGASVAISGDGNTIAVGAPQEDSAATGIGGDAGSNASGDAGAAYLFARSGTTWIQSAYVKASNTGAGDKFGYSVALDGTGARLAVGAVGEASAATVIGGDQTNNGASGAGAVYVFAKAAGVWAQQAYVKPSNTGGTDAFGTSLALSAEGSSLLVGAPGEDGSAVGVDGASNENLAGSGAAYLFTFDATGASWSQAHYLKASNAGDGDAFGGAVALGLDGDILAIGAKDEDGGGTGTTVADDTANLSLSAGAVYVY